MKEILRYGTIGLFLCSLVWSITYAILNPVSVHRCLREWTGDWLTILSTIMLVCNWTITLVVIIWMFMEFRKEK